MTALLILPSLGLFEGTPNPHLMWRPEVWTPEVWRVWTAAWVHLSPMHLMANLAGALLVGVLGVAARLPRRAALAWLMAWPLGHVGLLLMPSLLRYGGLSGVLHAGVAVIAVTLILRGPPAGDVGRNTRSFDPSEGVEAEGVWSAVRDRRLGWTIAAVLLAKLLSETPWRGPLAYPSGWDIATAPIAHATGSAAGALCAWVVNARLWLAKEARAARG